MPPVRRAELPTWFEDKSSYRNYEYVKYPDGTSQVSWRDGNGTYWNQEYDANTGTAQVPRYLDPTDHYWHAENADVDIYKDANGVWWKEEWDPRLGDYRLEIGDFEGGFDFERGFHWRAPEEGEEPKQLISQPQEGGRGTGQETPPPPQWPPPEVPPYLQLQGSGDGANPQGPWTYQGGGQHTATDQFGRTWEWYQRDDGTSTIGYRDEAGLWHETRQHDGGWSESFKGVDGNTYWGSLDPTSGGADRSYTDSSGTNHDEQYHPGKTLSEQEAEQEAQLEALSKATGLPPEQLKALAEERGVKPGDLTPEDVKASTEATRNPPPSPDNPGDPQVPEDGSPTAPGDVSPPPDNPPGDQEGEEGPPPYGQFPMIKDPATGEWVPATYDPDTGEFRPMEGGAGEGGTPGGGEGGYMGMGEPYVDFIPTIPMVKDPVTGEWRNAEPGELPGDQPPPYGQFPMGRDPNTGEWVPGTIDPDTGEFHPFESGADEGGEDQPPILDPNAQPMPMPSPEQFTTLEARLVPPDSPALIPGSPEYDPKAVPLGPDNVTINPDLLDPSAHEPVPYEDYIPFFPMVKDPVTGEWRNAEEGEIPGLGEEAPLPSPASQTPEPEPPVQPTPPPGDDDAGGFGDMGKPYVDVMPAMVQDPTTGEWRVMVQDPASGEWRPPDPAESLEPNIVPDLLDPSAPGPTLDSDLLDPSAPGPTLYPALLDPSAPGPTVDANLLDPSAPGPTLDPALLDASAPGPTLDPAQLDPSAPGPTLDPGHLERGIVEPGGVAEPADVTAQGFTENLLHETAHPEPTTAPGQDLDDPLNF